MWGGGGGAGGVTERETVSAAARLTKIPTMVTALRQYGTLGVQALPP